jgi:hypothetical protein
MVPVEECERIEMRLPSPFAQEGRLCLSPCRAGQRRRARPAKTQIVPWRACRGRQAALTPSPLLRSPCRPEPGISAFPGPAFVDIRAAAEYSVQELTEQSG